MSGWWVAISGSGLVRGKWKWGLEKYIQGADTYPLPYGLSLFSNEEKRES